MIEVLGKFMVGPMRTNVLMGLFVLYEPKTVLLIRYAHLTLTRSHMEK
jgi:hypothetical protein